MRKILFSALLIAFGAFASGAYAQAYSNRYGKIVLAGNGGIDVTNTLTLTSTALLSPKTYTFPTPVVGLFHSNAGGTLTLSAVDLNSADVTGLLQPGNGGTGVANTGTFTWGSNNITFITGGPTTITLPTSGTVLSSTGALTASRVVTTDISGNLVTTDLPNGALLIGNGGAPTAATLTAGSNITITNGAGTITINSTGGSGSGTTTGSTGNTSVYRAPLSTATSSTTLVNANGLSFPIGANEVWSFRGELNINTTTNTGYYLGISIPVSAVIEGQVEGLADLGAGGHTLFLEINAGSSLVGSPFQTVAADAGAYIFATVDNTGGAAGTVQIQFAAAVNTNTVTIKKNSFLTAWQYANQVGTLDQTYTSNTAIIIPTGVTQVWISGVGGAGGGGGGGAKITGAANNLRGASGGSGGAGEYIGPTKVTVVPGETLTITVGTGGAGGTGGTVANGASTVGGAGTVTTVVGSVSGSLFSANGGTNGTGGGNSTVLVQGTPAGTGGAGGVTAGSVPLANATAGSAGTNGAVGSNGTVDIVGPTGGNGPKDTGQANLGGTGGNGSGAANGVFKAGGTGGTGSNGYVKISY
jgi:hypothetical protein